MMLNFVRHGINAVTSFVDLRYRCLVVTVSLRLDRGEYVFCENACMVEMGEFMDGCSVSQMDV
jgi:hypothetical protein